MKKVNSLWGDKTDQELQEIYGLFVQLSDACSAMTVEDRRKVKRANFPFARIEKVGAMIFKSFLDLPKEERSQMSY